VGGELGQDRRGQIPGMVSIHHRPPEIEQRLVPGHWEGDLIKGADNRSAVGTLVERTTLFTVLARMDDAGAEAALNGFGQVPSRIEAQKRLSVTYDQDWKRAAHQRLTQATGVKVYFADPHSPWQRGINENTNGLLKRVSAQGQRPERFHPRRTGCDCLATKHQTPQIDGLPLSSRNVHPRCLRFQVTSRRTICTRNLKPLL